LEKSHAETPKDVGCPFTGSSSLELYLGILPAKSPSIMPNRGLRAAKSITHAAAGATIANFPAD
jgi:hypothetical protein